MKDFDRWNDLKKILDSRQEQPYCNKREIWWCSIGVNIGSEEDGKNPSFERPVLVIKVYNKSMARVIPLTSGIKDNEHYVHVSFSGKDNSVKISQLRTISTKRLLGKISRLDQAQFDTVVDRLKDTLT